MPSAPITKAVDLAIVGGGLAGGLLALAVRARHPDATVRLIDPGAALGGTHIWSFFDSDIAAGDRGWLAPLISRHWDSYDVRFPKRERRIATGYNSIRSDDFDRVLRANLGADTIVRGDAVVLTADRVTLSDQRIIAARAVVDARGPGDLSHFTGGWQKFVGKMLKLSAPHGVDRPVIMDATVPQIDGYRFVYLLPFAPDEIFVEDTYYSDDPVLDAATLDGRIDDYAAARGWQVIATSYVERGVLPVVSGGDFAAYLDSGDSDADIGRVGLRGGMFHAVTSFSLPDAVRTASAIADAWPLKGSELAQMMRTTSHARWTGTGFYRLLNKMLFRAAEPHERYRVLEHFHRLPQPVIERFYAGQTTVTDRLRILSGRPPVAILRALKAILDPQ